MASEHDGENLTGQEYLQMDSRLFETNNKSVACVYIVVGLRFGFSVVLRPACRNNRYFKPKFSTQLEKESFGGHSNNEPTRRKAQRPSRQEQELPKEVHGLIQTRIWRQCK